MTTFKDDLFADLGIFVETDEFAELTDVDGVLLKAQFQTLTQKKSGLESQNYEQLHGDFVTLHFKTSDYTGKRERIPKHGELCSVNGKRYDVINSRDDLGITKLVLSAYRQNTLRSEQFRRPSPFEAVRA